MKNVQNSRLKYVTVIHIVIHPKLLTMQKRLYKLYKQILNV